MGIKIAYKYRKYHEKSLIYAGFSIFFLGLSYYPATINLTLWIVESPLIAASIVLLCVGITFPLGILFYYFLLTEIKFYKIKKIQLTIRFFAIISNLLFEIYVIYTFFTNPTLLGVFAPPVNAEIRGPMFIYMVYAVLIFCIGGILIGIEGVKSNIPDVKLKGKFLLIAFILFFIVATLIDPFANIIRILDLIVVILLTLSAIFFYFGFILPDWLKGYLLKSK